MSPAYAPGHVPGAVNGYTRDAVLACHLPATVPTTVPDRLPVTGMSPETMAVAALLVLVGAILIALTRRTDEGQA